VLNRPTKGRYLVSASNPESFEKWFEFARLFGAQTQVVDACGYPVVRDRSLLLTMPVQP
jgi:hypothetical protein